MENSMIDESTVEQATATQPLSPVKGLMVVFGIALAVVIYLAITHYLGIAEFWAGFLWLFYWAGIEQMRFDRLNAAVGGATVGLLTALLLHLGPLMLGTAGLTGALVLVVVLVYSHVMGWVKSLVNNATMLFLTVGTITHLQVSGDFPQMFIALFVGVAFFGGLIWSGSLVGKKLSQKNS